MRPVEFTKKAFSEMGEIITGSHYKKSLKEVSDIQLLFEPAAINGQMEVGAITAVYGTLALGVGRVADYFISRWLEGNIAGVAQGGALALSVFGGVALALGGLMMGQAIRERRLVRAEEVRRQI